MIISYWFSSSEFPIVKNWTPKRQKKKGKRNYILRRMFFDLCWEIESLRTNVKF